MKIENKIKQEWKNIIFNCIFGILTILFIILFYRNILLASVLVGLVAVIGLIKWKSKITLLIFIFGAIFGAVAEMIAVIYGVWNYSITNFINIPFWLFLVWGNTAAFIYQTAVEIRRLGVRK